MKHCKLIPFVALLMAFTCAFVSCSDSLDDCDTSLDLGDVGTQTGSGTQLESFSLSFPVTEIHSHLAEVIGDEAAHIQLLFTGEEDSERIVMRATIESDGENYTITSQGDNIAKFTEQSYLLVGAHFSDPSEAMIEWLGEEIETVKNIGLLVNAADDYSNIHLTSTFNTTKADSTTVVGTGTSGDPYMIYNSTDLKTYLTDNYPGYGVYFKVASYIVVSDWTPVGDYDTSTYFGGHFDGSSGSYVMTKLSNSDGHDYFGLFCGLSTSSSVKNLHMTNVTITNAGSHVGVIAGHGTGNLTNVKVEGSISSEGSYVGGLMGQGLGTFIECESNITLNLSDSGQYNGGMVGYANSDITFTDCTSKAVINGNSSSVGGLVGYTQGDLSVSGCFIYGKLYGMNHVGGVVGKGIGDITITDSYIGDFQTGSVASESEAMISIKSGNSDSYGYDFGGMIGYAMGESGAPITVTISGSAVTSNSPDTPIIVVDDVKGVGGLVGSADYVDFVDCDYTCVGDLQASNTKSSDDDPYGVGGVIGKMGNCTLDGCAFVNNASISATGIKEVGGVIGYANFNRSATVANASTLTNRQSIDGGVNTGGIFGKIESSATVTNMKFTSVNSGYVTGYDYTGGIVGHVSGDVIPLLSSSASHNMSVTSHVTGTDYVGGFFAAVDVTDSDTNCKIWAEGDVTVSTSSSSGAYIGGVIGLISASNSSDSGCVFHVYSSDDEANLDVDVTGYSSVGGFVGGIDMGASASVTFYPYSFITGCVSPYTDKANALGGFAGQVTGEASGGVSIHHCYNRVKVNNGCSGVDNCGGIIGRVNSVKTTICFSCNVAEINASGTTRGGLVGYATNSSSSYQLKLEDSYNSGSVATTGDNRGGLIGSIDGHLTITNCYNSGSIDNSYIDDCVGGLIGRFNAYKKNSARGYVEFSYNMAESGWGTVGGADLHNGELDYHNVFYCNETNSDDMDWDDSAGTYSKADMPSNLKDKFSSKSSNWTFSTTDGGMPYLTNVTYYEGGYPSF